MEREGEYIWMEMRVGCENYMLIVGCELVTVCECIVGHITSDMIIWILWLLEWMKARHDWENKWQFGKCFYGGFFLWNRIVIRWWMGFSCVLCSKLFEGDFEMVWVLNWSAVWYSSCYMRGFHDIGSFISLVANTRCLNFLNTSGF